MTPLNAGDETDVGRVLAETALEVVWAEAFDAEGNDVPGVQQFTDENPRLVYEAFERELRIAGFAIVRVR